MAGREGCEGVEVDEVKGMIVVPAWEAYEDLIPSFDCVPGCTDCCGPHVWSAAEQTVIHRWLAEHGRPPLKATRLACPYLRPNKKRRHDYQPGPLTGLCSIYEVRPLLCRLYGVVEHMRCPHGRGPEALLTEAEEAAIMGLYRHELKEGL